MTDFGIGTSAGTIISLADLGVYEPTSAAASNSVDFDRADGLVSAHGWGTDTWSWALLPLSAYNTLRLYCAGKSASVYIRTLAPGKVVTTYSAVMVWPREEHRAGNYVIDFSVTFRLLAAA